jgi:GTPase
VDQLTREEALEVIRAIRRLPEGEERWLYLLGTEAEAELSSLPDERLVWLADVLSRSGRNGHEIDLFEKKAVAAIERVRNRARQRRRAFFVAVLLIGFVLGWMRGVYDAYAYAH